MNLLTILSALIGLILYGLICYYIGYNGWIWLKTTRFIKFKKSYISLIVFLSLSIFAGILLPYVLIQWISGFWMAIIGYSLLVLPIANILNYLLKKKQVFWEGVGVLSVYLFIAVYGTYNAWIPTVRTYNLEIDKNSNLKDLKIFMASDIHLGHIVGKSHLEKLVQLVEAEKPDIVLLPGDIINDNIEPYLENNLDQTFKKIQAPLGVYAVLGNHDYYGNDMEDIIAEMDKIGIQVLMDEHLTINNEFYLAGRKEHSDGSRKELSKYLKGLDKSKPFIMMDHQPKDLKEAQDHGVDLLLSGHTHRGQIAPAQLLTNLIYENDYGHLQKGDFHSIVSSGFGLWGPPLRIGTQAEVMVINLEFVGKK
jgi:uncharacterized protein